MMIKPWFLIALPLPDSENRLAGEGKRRRIPSNHLLRAEIARGISGIGRPRSRLGCHRPGTVFRTPPSRTCERVPFESYLEELYDSGAALGDDAGVLVPAPYPDLVDDVEQPLASGPQLVDPRSSSMRRARGRGPAGRSDTMKALPWRRPKPRTDRRWPSPLTSSSSLPNEGLRCVEDEQTTRQSRRARRPPRRDPRRRLRRRRTADGASHGV